VSAAWATEAPRMLAAVKQALKNVFMIDLMLERYPTGDTRAV
jgi:hypothetical protein